MFTEFFNWEFNRSYRSHAFAEAKTSRVFKRSFQPKYVIPDLNIQTEISHII
jgi:hypothetical protein